MIVLDAYAVLALLKGEPAASEVRRLLESGEPASLTVIGVAEVLDHLIRLEGADEDDAALDLAQLDLLAAADLDHRVAVAAGSLRARHYHRTKCSVSLADCVAAAFTRSASATLATSDPHLLQMCWQEQIPTLVLPGSDGSRWSPP